MSVSTAFMFCFFDMVSLILFWGSEMKSIASACFFVAFLVFANSCSAQLSLDRLGDRSNEQLEAAYSNYFSLHSGPETFQKLRIVDILSSMKAFGFEKPENREILELTVEQIEDIAKIKKHYSNLIEKVYGKLPGCDELDFDRMAASEELAAMDVETQRVFRELKPCVELDVFDVLMEPQIRQLAFVHLRMGLPKVLVESPVGLHLELSDAQKERIAENATKLAEEIDQLVRKANQRSVELVKEELSDEQWEKLESYFGKQAISQYPKGLSIEYLMRIYDMNSIYPLPGKR